MTKRIDPTRSLRGRTGRIRELLRATHQKPPVSHRREWEAVDAGGIVIATAKYRASLTEFFGGEFVVRRKSQEKTT